MSDLPTTAARRLQAHHNQVKRLTQTLARLGRESSRLSTLRLLVASVGFALIFVAFQFAPDRSIGWAALLLFMAGFSWLVYIHRRLRAEIRRLNVWRNIKQTHIARMTLDWQQLPSPSAHTQQNRTPLEIDFDLVGDYSLHRLLDTTVSAEASERLRGWLSAGEANSAEISRRQTLLRELIPLHYFRNTLILNAHLIRDKGGRWDNARLQQWINETDSEEARRWLAPAIVLAILTSVSFLLTQAGILGNGWQLALLAYAAVNVMALRSTGRAFSDATYLRDALEGLQIIFGQLETFQYRNAPHLKRLCGAFVADNSAETPSSHLQRVVRVVGWLGLTMGNPIVALLLHAVFPWHILLTVRLNRIKAQLASQLPMWLDTWFELETLSALATFAYLNPHYTFPQSNQQGIAYEAAAMGHPLLSHHEKVRNDCASGDSGSINLITGSNMAGKSTFLRTIGINLTLAYAGTVVDAAQLTFTPARLISCIRVTDSIADGFSYFYAEVRCLKAILDALEQPNELPLIFFIDEIFRGTNNRERLIGSRALIKAMAGQNGVGLLSTHDLELVQLADTIPLIHNYHFREEVIDGKMVFDYLLRHGPCPTTNALRIMALAGLPIEPTL